ncbi:MAG: nuclear transport factor 2 family protein [Novosphingobium sp.]|nr:nuclear transport factor 2 family protein [Novosphingobium sp.]
MDALEAMLAEREIGRMIVDYAAANDAGDWDAVAATYVEDGRMSRPTAPDAFIEGRAAILVAFNARPPRITRHIVANIRVDVSDETACATSQILLFTAAGQPPLVGSYHDKLVKTPHGWRFTERRGSLDFA